MHSSFAYVSSVFFDAALFIEDYSIFEQKPSVFCLDTLGFLNLIEHVGSLRQ